MDVCASTPVNAGSLMDTIRLGVPRTIDANDTGYTPRSSSAPPPTVSQQAGEIITLASAHIGAEPQIIVGDAHDLSGTHDGAAVHTPVLDLLHGFIIH